MNEQIRKITGQVLDELVPQTWTTLGYDKIKEIQYRTAELIVESCAQEFDNTYMTGGKTMGGYLREKFGVDNGQ